MSIDYYDMCVFAKIYLDTTVNVTIRQVINGTVPLS